MLAGIKTGKRKRKKGSGTVVSDDVGGLGGPPPSPRPRPPLLRAVGGGGGGGDPADRPVVVGGEPADGGAAPPSSSSDRSGGFFRAAGGGGGGGKSYGSNASAADELRRLLRGGGGRGSGASSGGKEASSEPRSGGSSSFPPSSSPSRTAAASSSSLLDRLERRGRIAAAAPEGEDDDDEDAGDVVVLAGAAAAPGRHELRREDFRRGARRGKIRRTEAESSSAETMTVERMLVEERAAARSMDETFARNVSRLGSRYKHSEFAVTVGSSAGADETDPIDASVFDDPSSRLTAAARAERERSRQLASFDRETAYTAKCWWWLRSPSFEKRRLLALGDHVSLVSTPKRLRLTEGQCYLVPVKHAESFVSCENEVWDEVKRFRSSLRAMFAKEGKGVLFCETVLPSSKGLWQARMDVVPVPRRVDQDAAIYFKSALADQSEEWGTHDAIRSTTSKGLIGTIPKRFPYFNVEWTGGGYAQIIESASFPPDFGLDTIAGMMRLDPPRLRRRERKGARGNDDEEDRAAVLEFCDKWKSFDWTLELDGEGGGGGGSGGATPSGTK